MFDDDEYSIVECLTCGLPVPEEAAGNVFCDSVCENKAIDEALWKAAIEESMAKERDVPVMDVFANMFPVIVPMPKPAADDFCSCHSY